MSYSNALGMSWADLKANMVNRPEAVMSFVETERSYYVLLSDTLFEISALVEKNLQDDPEHTRYDEQADFEDNHKPTCNQRQPLREVVTQFEKNDKRLKLAWESGLFGDSNDCVLSIRVPAGGRWIAGGWAVTDAFAFGDCLSKVQVVDDQGLVAPPGSVLAVYHDQDVPEDNQGWAFWPEPGNRGGCEIEPIGGYGYLPEGMLLEMHVHRVANSPAKGVLVNLWWAKNE